MKRLKVQFYAETFRGVGLGAQAEYVPQNRPDSWQLEIRLTLLCLCLVTEVWWLPPLPPPVTLVPVRLPAARTPSDVGTAVRRRP